ncbi:MAG: DUF3616 domain-containing protein, partial [Planctomycetes bacterium]|nr:DUF3616 domain-containing protein [Planctomycetota bacterium]
MYRRTDSATPSSAARPRRTTPAILPVAMVLATAICLADGPPPPAPLTWRGMSDASAAAAVDDGHMLTADDETNSLRLYRLDGGLPVTTVDLSAWLKTDADHPEADIEGAARVGRRIYWITSHGRNKDGKYRASRHRFFAVDLDEGTPATARPAGKPFADLAMSLVRAPHLQALGLADAIGVKDGAMDRSRRKNLAPKDDGFNIEALAASADGRVLYVGLRNPRPKGPDGRRRAVVLPLLNAPAVVERGEQPQWGPPLLWDLDGRGLRSMEYIPHRNAFLLLAGPHDGENGGALYRWSGDPAQP